MTGYICNDKFTIVCFDNNSQPAWVLFILHCTDKKYLCSIKYIFILITLLGLLMTFLSSDPFVRS